MLLGPSGSGKSTLARCIAGVERLDEGTIHFGGTLVSDGRRHLPPERRNLAMVFQDYALWPHMTVAQNVGYALRRRSSRAGPPRAPRRGASSGWASAARRRATRTSCPAGEQQRVALARAVVAEPALLLFDEPLSNLDADLRERLRVEIATLTRGDGATALYITHDQSEAFALADEIAVLHDGPSSCSAERRRRSTGARRPRSSRASPVSPAPWPGHGPSWRGESVEVRVGDRLVRAR